MEGVEIDQPEKRGPQSEVAGRASLGEDQGICIVESCGTSESTKDWVYSLD